MEYYVPSLNRVLAVFNTKTQYHNFCKKNLVTGKRNVQILSEFILENDIAYMGTQELTKPHQELLADSLPDYTIYGGYRFGNHIANHIPMVKDFNESSAIISKYPIDQRVSGTKHLPSFPTMHDIALNGFNTFTKLQPRIMTIIVSPGDRMVHVNTHLHDSFPEKREVQENYLVKQIDLLKQKYPNYGFIVTGDFNDSLCNLSFQIFYMKMDALGLRRVPIMQRTYSKQKENIAIDHIFISENMELEDYKVISEGPITETSDHYPVVAKVKLYSKHFK